MPSYVSDIETLAAEWGYDEGTCGQLTYWLEMQNGRNLPYFITLEKMNPVWDTYDYLYVYAKPTNESDAGSWPVQYCVGLADPEFALN